MMTVKLTNGLNGYVVRFLDRKNITRQATIEAQEVIINDFLNDDIDLGTICDTRNMWLEKIPNYADAQAYVCNGKCVTHKCEVIKETAMELLAAVVGKNSPTKNLKKNIIMYSKNNQWSDGVVGKSIFLLAEEPRPKVLASYLNFRTRTEKENLASFNEFIVEAVNAIYNL